MSGAMTSRERIVAALKREPVDRIPFLLWGLDTIQMNPDISYKPLLDYMAEHADINYRWRPEPNPCFQEYNGTPVDIETESTDDGESVVTRTVLHTPRGSLHEVTQTVPGTIITATRRRFVESLDDLHKWFSIPYLPWTPPVGTFFEAQATVGDRGVVVYRATDPYFAVNSLFEPEAFALACRDDAGAIHEAVDTMCQRTLDHFRHILEEGARPIFIIQGCEAATPPMQSPAHFYDFVVRYEKPLVDLVHEYGCLAIVHCHGNVNAVLERLVELGYDGTHPIEEPPMGDITLREFKRRVGDDISVVGNIQIGEMISATPEQIEALTRHAIEDGGPRGLVLSPTATPYERPMSERTFANYRRLIETAIAWGS